MLHNEAERPDWDDLDLAEVYDILLDLAAEPGFLDTPVEAVVAQVGELVGLNPDVEDAPPPDAASPPPAPPSDTG